jgi:membrane-bound toxin of toxin-antitoxin system
MLFPCEIAPQSSRLMMAGLVAGHLALGQAFLRSSLPPAGIGLALAALLAGGIVTYRRWLRRTSGRFILRQEGTMQVIPPAGAAYEARAERGCRDLGWAVWLAWRSTAEEGAACHGQRGILMLPRDTLSPEAWRALRIWLRFRSGLATADPRG